MRYIKLSLIAMLVLALGVSVAFADEPDNQIPYINDGRVNSWELAAPAAVFCQYEYDDPIAPSEILFDRIDVYNTNSGQLLFSIPQEVLENSFANEPVAQQDGFSLYQPQPGAFTVTLNAPTGDGNVYEFSWERGDQNC
jgi:hypothetical protein